MDDANECWKDLPVVRCRKSEVISMDYNVLQQALDHGLCPVVYGDVAFDGNHDDT